MLCVFTYLGEDAKGREGGRGGEGVVIVIVIVFASHSCNAVSVRILLFGGMFVRMSRSNHVPREP